jgi:hypothetical protein
VLIEGHRGTRWFEQILAEMRDHEWGGASDCSHNLLNRLPLLIDFPSNDVTLVAANAEQGLTLNGRNSCSGSKKGDTSTIVPKYC